MIIAKIVCIFCPKITNLFVKIVKMHIKREHFRLKILTFIMKNITMKPTIGMV